VCAKQWSERNAKKSDDDEIKNEKKLLIAFDFRACDGEQRGDRREKRTSTDRKHIVVGEKLHNNDVMLRRKEREGKEQEVFAQGEQEEEVHSVCKCICESNK
jgi:hypothetical protein